jgi:hypothetical protein
MNQSPALTFWVTGCVNPAQIGWIHATAAWVKSGDKADFHAMVVIWGVA